LFTIAQRLAIDVLRRSGRESSLEDDDDQPWSPGGSAWQDWPGPASDPADLAFWHAAGERLLHCLEEIPLAQKAVFLMHHEEGLTLDDAARSLKIGFETAKSRLRYAMAKLRACMGAYLPARHRTEAA
jgi:RNA polymerase sigma-70 factor (ECF subfamily)